MVQLDGLAVQQQCSQIWLPKMLMEAIDCSGGRETQSLVWELRDDISSTSISGVSAGVSMAGPWSNMSFYVYSLRPVPFFSKATS